MRYQPAFVDRVAGKSAAKVVVYAALTDVLERQDYGVEIACLAGALAGPPEEFEQHRLWKFGRPAGAAVDWIEQAAELLSGAIELRGADHHPALWARALGEPLHQGAAIVLDARGVVAEDARDVVQHIDEGGLSVATFLREIRAAPERLAGGGEEHGQWPT